jgi:hypothetical protein
LRAWLRVARLSAFAAVWMVVLMTDVSLKPGLQIGIGARRQAGA